MKEPRWLNATMIRAIHTSQVQEHGGSLGLRDPGLPMYVFLGLNGLRIEAEEPEVVRLILALASGELPEPQLADWLRQHTVSR